MKKQGRFSRGLTEGRRDAYPTRHSRGIYNYTRDLYPPKSQIEQNENKEKYQNENRTNQLRIRNNTPNPLKTLTNKNSCNLFWEMV